MTNPSKQRGTAFETAVCDYLRTHGHPNAERKAMQGANDCGDITGITNWTFELKAERRLDLAGALAEAQLERTNAGTAWCAAIIKRRQKNIADAYVVMTLQQFCDLTSQ